MKTLKKCYVLYSQYNVTEEPIRHGITLSHSVATNWLHENDDQWYVEEKIITRDTKGWFGNK